MEEEPFPFWLRGMVEPIEGDEALSAGFMLQTRGARRIVVRDASTVLVPDDSVVTAGFPALVLVVALEDALVEGSGPYREAAVEAVTRVQAIAIGVDAGANRQSIQDRLAALASDNALSAAWRELLKLP
jgi:hypothetical protein